MLIDLLDNTNNIEQERKCEQLVQIFEGLFKAQRKDSVVISEEHFNLLIQDENRRKEYEKTTASGFLIVKLANVFLEDKKECFKTDFEQIYQKSDDELISKVIQNMAGYRNLFSHGGIVNKFVPTLHPYYLNALLIKAIRLIIFQDILGINEINYFLEDV